MRADVKRELFAGTIAWAGATLLWFLAPDFLQGSRWRIPVVVTVWAWWPAVAVQYVLSKKK